MARTPWAFIKRCLPCWLLESAPYKQAFVLFITILFPALLLSPFLLSPLLTLLLLFSATVAGALSAWISMKASRTVLKHTTPLHVSLSLSSCFKTIIKPMGMHILESVTFGNRFPWTWLWFVKIPETAVSKDGGVGSQENLSMKVEGIVGSLEENYTVSRDTSKCILGCNTELGQIIEQGKEMKGSVSAIGEVKTDFKEHLMASDRQQISLSVHDHQVMGAEKEEKVCIVDSSGGGIVNISDEKTLSERRKHVVYFSKCDDSPPDLLHSHVELREEIKVEDAGDDHSQRKPLNVDMAIKGDHAVKKISHFAVESECKLQTLPQKPIMDDDLLMKSESIPGLEKAIDVGPKEMIGIVRSSKSCMSHSWCRKGVTFEEELALLVEDIYTLCLGKWYPSLSSNEEFPLEVKILFDMCVRRAATLGEGSDLIALVLKLGTLFLCHLREFRKSRRKKRAAECQAAEARKEVEMNEKNLLTPVSISLKEELTEKISDPCQTEHEKATYKFKPSSSPQVAEMKSSFGGGNLVATSEEDLAKHSGEGLPRSASPLLKDSHAGLVKRSILNEVSKGEEAYYRLRFGHSSLKRNTHGNYLMDLSLLIVKDFVGTVGKLPVDPEVKHYFKHFGSSLAETPPGKILVSMIACKVFLPLVDTVSDPNWLNVRIASLLVNHAGAKVYMVSSENNDDSLSYFASGTDRLVDLEDGCEHELSYEGQLSTPSKLKESEESCVKNEDCGSREERRKSLSLPLEVGGNSITNPINGRISSVLGGIISATAGPLLPDNVGISYKPIKRMWSSPSVEEGKELDEESEVKKKNGRFGRLIVDGLPVESSSLSERIIPVSGQVGVVSDVSSVATHPMPLAKGFLESPQQKAISSNSAKKPPKKKFLGLPFGSQQPSGALPHSGLFRSKSSHNVQMSNEENWHIEEGSELHEGLYLSDDPGSPVTLDKEDKDSFGRKSARSRSFHGMKNYNHQRERYGARVDHKQGKEEQDWGSSASYEQGNEGIFLKFDPKKEEVLPHIPLEDSMGEGSDTVFQDSEAKAGDGLRMRWVKHSSGKRRMHESRGESEEMESGGSGPAGIVERNALLYSEECYSEECESPVFKTIDKSYHSTELDQQVPTGKNDEICASELEGDSGKETGVPVAEDSQPVAMADGNMKESMQDISPVYEEVEDLPSTVAKLKAFLRERNGSQKSEDSVTSSVDGVRKEMESISSLEMSMDQEVSQILKPQSSPLEVRPFSWPSDGGIFLNIRIPYTEICRGTSASQSSNPLSYNSPHVFYCIEYDAAYPEEGADAAVVSAIGEDPEGSSGMEKKLNIEGASNSPVTADSTEMVLPSPGTVVNHVVVKRQFQEFLDLHSHLESDPLWRQALKGLKGPSRWLNLPFGKASASTVAGRRTLLQAYLRGVCTTMPQLASRSKALRSFMAYQGAFKGVAEGEALPSSVERVLPVAVEGGEGSVPRIDKLFARTVSGMFNTLKTALPGFDSQDANQQPSVGPTSALSTPLPPSDTFSHLDTSSAPAVLGESRTSFGQSSTIKGTMMQLPAFLQFRSNNVPTYPDLVDWDMDYGERDSTGFNSSGSVEGLPIKTYSLEEDVQSFLERLINSPTSKDDVAEFAFEALDPFSICEDFKDFGEQSLQQALPKGHSRPYLVDSGDEDGEEEELDAVLPLCKVAINILCEALRGTGSWVSQGTVVHASKVILGFLIEQKLQEFFKNINTKEMWCHYVHLLRIVLFHPPPSNSNQDANEQNACKSISGQQLAMAIFTAFPSSFRQIIGNQELSEAAKFVADSLQNKVILRDLVLQVLHVCITHITSSGNRSLAES